MAVTNQVRLTLNHHYPSTSTFFFIRRKLGFTTLRDPLPRDENEDDACEIVCLHCGETLLVRYGSMASVRRVQARWRAVLAICVVILIASIAFLASQAGKVLPEGTPLSPFFGPSVVGVAVGFVLGVVAFVARQGQRVAVLSKSRAPHTAAGRAVPAVATSTR